MKAVVKMLVFGVVLTGMISIAGADTITIQGSDEVIDSFLLGNGSAPIDGNYGGASRTTVDINALTSGYNRNGIFRWNLDNLPIDGNQITMVEIMFYVDNYNSASTLKYDLRQIIGGDWGETTVTAVKYDGTSSWANQTAYPWGDLSAEICGTVKVNTQNVWITFNSVDDADLLTIVRDMADGIDNYGFSVEGQSSTSILLKLRSTDHGTALTRPKMIITYAANPTINIQGSDDVIDSFLLGQVSAPNIANYGSRTTVDVNGATISGYNRNGIFRWDLNDVPIAGNLITNVEIMLYVDAYDSTGTLDYDLRQIITGGDWVESEVSAINRSTGPDAPWTNQTTYPWGDLSTETYGTASVNTPDVWVTFSSDDDSDLLTLVQGMVDGTVSNYGFSVEGQTGSSIVLKLRSTDHGTASTRPKMFLSYVIPKGTVIIIE